MQQKDLHKRDILANSPRVYGIQVPHKSQHVYYKDPDKENQTQGEANVRSLSAKQ